VNVKLKAGKVGLEQNTDTSYYKFGPKSDIPSYTYRPNVSKLIFN